MRCNGMCWMQIESIHSYTPWITDNIDIGFLLHITENTFSVWHLILTLVSCCLTWPSQVVVDMAVGEIAQVRQGMVSWFRWHAFLFGAKHVGSLGAVLLPNSSRRFRFWVSIKLPGDRRPDRMRGGRPDRGHSLKSQWYSWALLDILGWYYRLQ